MKMCLNVKAKISKDIEMRNNKFREWRGRKVGGFEYGRSGDQFRWELGREGNIWLRGATKAHTIHIEVTVHA